MAVSKLVRNTPSPKRKSTTPFNEFKPYEEQRKRNLRFDLNALADFEQETGMGFAQLMKQKAVFASARAMLWAGLKHEDRALTIEDVGNLLQQYMIDPDAEDHSINAILGVAVMAAVEQGALGKIAEPKPGEDEDYDTLKKELEGTAPNAPGVLDGEVSTDSMTPTPTTPATEG